MSNLVQDGAVVLPAYLVSEAEVDALARTVADLPSTAAVQVAVLQPGPAGMPDLAALDRHPRLRRVELARGVGKWPAFVRGLQEIRDELSGGLAWTAVVDADHAFPGASVAALAEVLLGGDFDHAIGSRRPEAIDLRASDQASPHQRLHVEAFFNTLTLLVSGCADDAAMHGADLQCGLHVFAPARLAALLDAELPFYGGELHCFHESRVRGARVGFAPVEVRENPVSAYRLAEITRELLALPFLAQCTTALREEALARTAELYAAWPLDAAAFERDLRALLGMPRG